MALFYRAPSPAARFHTKQSCKETSPSLLQETKPNIRHHDNTLGKEHGPKMSTGNLGLNILAQGTGEKTTCRKRAKQHLVLNSFACKAGSRTLPGAQVRPVEKQQRQASSATQVQLLARRGPLVCEAAEQGAGVAAANVAECPC